MTRTEPLAPASHPQPNKRRRLAGVRGLSLRVWLVSVSVLGLAAYLTPDARGYGTHEHLLLPPCFFRLLTTLPCPFCGMTTAFAHLAHGHFAEAARCNLMGAPAFVVTVLLALGSLWGMATGRAWWPPLLERADLPRLLLVVIMLFWIANLVLHYMQIT